MFALCLTSNPAFAVIKKTHLNIQFNVPTAAEKNVKNELKAGVEVNENIAWQKEKNWKTLEAQKKEFSNRPKTIDSISQLALLELYSDNYEKAYEHFAKLNHLKPSMLHQYYEALSLSIVDPYEGREKWRLYFSSSSYRAEKKIWKSLGEEVLKTINAQAIHNTADFKGIIFWFYTQRAFYTTYMLIELYRQYVPEREKTLADKEFMEGTKANILIKLGFLKDGIVHLQKIETPSDDQKRKLAVSYYYTKEYRRAIKTFAEIENPTKKNSTYYYYLSLTHLRLNNLAEYKKNAMLLQRKQNTEFKNNVRTKISQREAQELKKARQLFQRLNSLYPVSS